MKKSLLLIGLLTVGIVVILLFRNAHAPTTDTVEPVVCAQDALQCPDGSYVSRTGPRCEFSACPPSTIPTGWVSGSSDTAGVTYSYPEQLSATYTHTTDWPPVISIQTDPYTCNSAGSEIERAGQTQEQVINNRTYCVTRVTDGAAGSIYTQYAYSTELNGKHIKLTFTMRAVQCGNYDEPKKSACEKELQAFTIDPIIDQIVSTIRPI